jgi:hypothetical protein
MQKDTTTESTEGEKCRARMKLKEINTVDPLNSNSY